MPLKLPTRQDAWDLLNKYNSKESLINHALSVEAVMLYMAKKNNEPEEEWGVIGLIHDLDYEQYPDQHCLKTKQILEENDWPEEYIRAVMSHGWGIVTDVEPQTLLEKTLYTIDELAGFVTACALVRPSKSVTDLEVQSVRKKWKKRDFAAGVDREVVQKGSEMLGVELNDLIADVITALRGVSKEIGL